MKNKLKAAMIAICFILTLCGILGCGGETGNPSDSVSTGSDSDTAQEISSEEEYVFVRFSAEAGGRIEGETEQQLLSGEDSRGVTAVAEEGYRFVQWSDGDPDESKQLIGVTESVELTAQFEKIWKSYRYNYHFATGNCTEEEVSLVYGELGEKRLAVPEREHCTFEGWYLDEDCTKLVADETGKIVVGNEILEEEGEELFAEWTANEKLTYKILMVYVTEIQATLTSVDGREEEITVDYHMSDLERRICEMITDQLERHLDSLDIVDFTVDEYYTTEVMTRENMNKSTNAYYIIAENIPEVGSMLEEYQSIITMVDLNSYNSELHNMSGLAREKYACVFFDSFKEDSIINEEPLELLLDPEFWRWGYNLNTHVHEFLHTIEQDVNLFSLHEVTAEYAGGYDKMRGLDLYILNQAVVDGQRVGVPYEYWQGKIATLVYDAEPGGFVFVEKGTPSNVEHVIYGRDSRKVIVLVHAGYEFIGWSDGVTTLERIDRNVWEDLHVTALFRKIED